MFLRRLACSILAVSLLGGLATAAPSDPTPYRYEDDLAEPQFARPPQTDGDEQPAATAAIDRIELRAVLAERRAQNLARFRAYRQGGMYPHNFDRAGKLNVWLDREGHLCAAATIIANSGNGELAYRVPADDNFLRLADVTEGPLMDWMLTSGFTQDEIAAIQEPFMGRMEPSVEPDRRRLAEDNRLRKRYAQVDRMLVKATKRSLDRAVDRLLDENPTLAAALLAID